jgi:hypothetical protein
VLELQVLHAEKKISDKELIATEEEEEEAAEEEDQGDYWKRR